MANLDLESVLSIPSEGTKKITELLNRQQERLNQIENQIQPAVSSVKDWATETFTLPPWLKILIYAAFIVGILALCFIGLKSVKKSLATMRRPNCKPDNNDQSDYVPISALYPPLPTLNYPTRIPPEVPCADPRNLVYNNLPNQIQRCGIANVNE